VGGAFVLLLALIHAELGGAFPVAGGSARFPHYSHGSIVGFAIGWIAWLGAVTTVGIEVEAALQYFTHYASWLTTQSGNSTVLTAQGYAVAAVLVLLFTIVNMLGVRKLARSNNLIMLWKVAIPFLAVAAIMVTAFHASNFHAADDHLPALPGLADARRLHHVCDGARLCDGAARARRAQAPAAAARPAVPAFGGRSWRRPDSSSRT
jgi:amino acid transporter